ncbi:uncharacterized protein LOC110107454 [Dendrobium catenatum]|uniref:uncharacterized protein LOC110107454 n=1 Tax=Dendrobium catenatum TaxID=906689 RepID=UPI0009F5858D|nr:uncharacterized protein LOC110107454 [Dendrobium catenatum]
MVTCTTQYTCDNLHNLSIRNFLTMSANYTNHSTASNKLLANGFRNSQTFFKILDSGNDEQTLDLLLKQLQSHFALKQLGNVSLFLGIQILKTSTASEADQAFHDLHMYRQLASSLQYLSITHPNIVFATNRTCQYIHALIVGHNQALKRILRYVKGTLHFGLPIDPGNLQLRTYVDADWASDILDRKSISGFYTFLGQTLISWS